MSSTLAVTVLSVAIAVAAAAGAPFRSADEQLEKVRTRSYGSASVGSYHSPSFSIIYKSNVSKSNSSHCLLGQSNQQQE
jgi:hypothetical protein